MRHYKIGRFAFKKCTRVLFFCFFLKCACACIHSIVQKYARKLYLLELCENQEFAWHYLGYCWIFLKLIWIKSSWPFFFLKPVVCLSVNVHIFDFSRTAEPNLNRLRTKYPWGDSSLFKWRERTFLKAE
jgi:hypothetical protein